MSILRAWRRPVKRQHHGLWITAPRDKTLWKHARGVAAGMGVARLPAEAGHLGPVSLPASLLAHTHRDLNRRAGEAEGLA